MFSLENAKFSAQTLERNACDRAGSVGCFSRFVGHGPAMAISANPQVLRVKLIRGSAEELQGIQKLLQVRFQFRAHRHPLTAGVIEAQGLRV